MKKMFIRLGLTAFMMTMVMIPGNMSKAATIDTDEMQTIPYVLSEKTDGMAEDQLDTINSISHDTAEPDGIFTTKYIVTASKLNVRCGPGTTYEITGYLYLNDIVKVKSISDGWAKFKQDGQWRYVSATYLKKK